ncbi:MAG: patatin-like phospholipase family protein [Bacteroidales bacterium]|jgi:NTE family protein|nr:patatin-like phospholipase family protein [Bacteroidales bacterium]MDD2424718.1 patatin-like phospholipase family protein [Bacteroidales bacterium]MDD3989285.1 patatin-like phospholipase family protein [Bacteroidales bacterium]MDD4638582.1 patatin-like phospholipase family protein [Bacteroidales bacterium]
MEPVNVALVLSGGGARGCAHIGVIRILEQSGFRISSVAGTSMGALIGGIYAAGGMEKFSGWISSLDRMEILKMTDITISSSGFVKGNKIIDKMKEIIPDRNIEDLPIPYCAVATDIINKKEKLFCSGNLYDAIRASISIPTLFQPFYIGGNYYVDGGLVNQIPVNRVVRTAGDILVAVDVGSAIPVISAEYQSKPGTFQNDQVELKDNSFLVKHLRKIEKIQRKFNHMLIPGNKESIGIFNLSNRSIGIMMRRISDLMLDRYPPDILIQISKESYSSYDFYKAQEIIKEGERAALEAITRYNSGRIVQ